MIHSASGQDQDGAKSVLEKLNEKFRRLKIIFADSGYGRFRLSEWTRDSFGWLLQIILRPVGIKGFVVLPKRWVVERTFAWLTRYRRHNKVYEKTTQPDEAIVNIATIALITKRLAKNQIPFFKPRSKLKTYF